LKILTKIFLTVSLIFLCSQQSYSQWIRQQSGTTSNLQDVCFLNSETGFACGSNTILKTTNSGFNWVKTEHAGMWNSVYFVNANTGFICGDLGKIIKSTNAGQSWFSLNTTVTKNLNNINFKNENTGYVSGWSKTLLKTTDGGNTFTSAFSNASYMWQRSFIMDDYVFLAGTDGAFFRSSNSGTTWDSLYLGMPNVFSAVKFFENGTGYVFGCCGAYYKTTNFGNHWGHDTVYLTNGWALDDCSFVNQQAGWAAGEMGSIVRTTNGGISWEKLNSETQLAIRTIEFINAQTGWIAGKEGFIAKTTNGGGAGSPIGIQNQSVSIAENFSLYQNYPNPFNPSTIIKFSLAKSSDVKLTVYSLNGKTEEVLTENFYNAGEYSVEWKPESKSSGIYFYKIETESGSEMRKMLFVK